MLLRPTEARGGLGREDEGGDVGFLDSGFDSVHRLLITDYYPPPPQSHCLQDSEDSKREGTREADLYQRTLALVWALRFRAVEWTKRLN